MEFRARLNFVQDETSSVSFAFLYSRLRALIFRLISLVNHGGSRDRILMILFGTHDEISYFILSVNLLA